MTKPSRPFIIGVSGGSGSGKTSFIRDLKALIPPKKLSVVSLDDYYRPLSQQKKDTHGVSNFDLPESFDSAKFMIDLRRLSKGEALEITEYTFNNRDKKGETIIILPAPVIIVEGLFSLCFLEDTDLLDMKVFIHAHPVHKVVRRVKRDRIERNYPLEDVLYRYVHHVNPSFDKYIGRFRESADIVINNNESYEMGLELMKTFILSKT